MTRRNGWTLFTLVMLPVNVALGAPWWIYALLAALAYLTVIAQTEAQHYESQLRELEDRS